MLPDPLPSPFKVHLGGEERREGWFVVNAQPGEHVDLIADIRDLSAFGDGIVDEIYASHILEHLSYQRELPDVLRGIRRVLKPGGAFRISVPDLQVLAKFMANPSLGLEQQRKLMRIIYGGQIDPFDFHKCGFTEGLLRVHLNGTGFMQFERVESHNLFQDTSEMDLAGISISINAIAR